MCQLAHNQQVFLYWAFNCQFFLIKTVCQLIDVCDFGKKCVHDLFDHFLTTVSCCLDCYCQQVYNFLSYTYQTLIEKIRPSVVLKIQTWDSGQTQNLWSLRNLHLRLRTNSDPLESQELAPDTQEKLSPSGVSRTRTWHLGKTQTLWSLKNFHLKPRRNSYPPMRLMKNLHTLVS